MHIYAAGICSPGRQIRPVNPPGDPRSHHWRSVWRPMNSLGFAENISEWNWTYDSTDELISCVSLCLCLSKTRASIGSFWPFFNWFHQSGTKPNFFCSQNFCYHLWCLFCNICRCFQKYVQWGSDNNVIKYCGWGIPHNWDISFGKFGGLN